MLFRSIVSILLVAVLSSSAPLLAQHYSNFMERDTLSGQTWRPQQAFSRADSSLQKLYKYSYFRFADLAAWQAKGTPVQVLEINDNAASRGGWQALRALPKLQRIRLTISNQVYFDSLMQVIGDLPIQTLEIGESFGDGARSSTIIIPATVARLSQLKEVMISGNDPNGLSAGLTSLAGVPSLRTLTIQSLGTPLGPIARIPATLGGLSQLTRLDLTINASQFEGALALGTLTNLERLTINHWGTTILESQRVAVGTALSNLTALRELSIPVTILPDTFNANLAQLRLLNLTSQLLHGKGEKQPDFPQLGPLPGLERLILSNLQVSPALCSYRTLKQLIINNNVIEELPACLGDMRLLEELSVVGSSLKQLPTSLGNLTNLTALSINYTPIDSIPDLFGGMRRLKQLSFSNNQVRYLPPSVSQLTSLTSLEVTNTQLRTLPDDLHKLADLRQLYLHENKLSRLPERIADLKALQFLTLDGNQLTQLPAGMGRLKKLKRLSMAQNRLTQLPGDLALLDSLYHLGIDQNQLTSLPANLGRLQQLRTLNLEKNRLVTLPESLGDLSQLSNLLINENPLVELPLSLGKLDKLKELTIRQTKLKMLPSTIGKLQNLAWLQVSQSDLLTLPTEIGNCSGLQFINLEGNPLIGLPASIGRLKKLLTLTIQGGENGVTKLEELPDSLRYCTELTQVRLGNLPNLAANEAFMTLLALPKLFQLDMVQTPLSQLPLSGWRESNVTMLNLSSNALTELPPALLEAPKLRTISLFENPLPKGVAGSFNHVDQLRVAMAEAGWATLDNLPRKSTHIAEGFIRSSGFHAMKQEWSEAEDDLTKAIGYAPDSVVSPMYAQRAEFYFFRKQFDKSFADIEQALANWPALKLPITMGNAPMSEQTKLTNRALWWWRKSVVRQALGQTDAALADINHTVTLLPPSMSVASSGRNLRYGSGGMPPARLEAMVYTEQGKLLALKNRFLEADSAFSRAMRAYELVPFADPGSHLTIVELGIITGQYARAKTALVRMPERQRQDGFALLAEYLKQAAQVAEGTSTGPDAVAALKTFINNTPGRIAGWSFELFDNWLNRTTLPTDRRDALRELTTLVKERQLKMD
ncbi:MAG: hypothetical protein EAZ91_20780 [Cytophagales bacterium]|nr:MAG: hypothetical protein EAZ91_20780 [Cytophagales bacterium]